MRLLLLHFGSSWAASFQSPPAKDGLGISPTRISPELRRILETSVYETMLSDQQVAFKEVVDKLSDLELTIADQIGPDAPSILIRPYGFVQPTPESSGLVMEWLEGGIDLTCLPKPSEAFIGRVVRELLEGLVYLHARQIVHGNVSPSKILLGDNGQLRLLGYRDSRMEGSIRTFEKSHFELQQAWWSPECLEELPFGPAHDLWSVGMLVLSLASGYTLPDLLGNQERQHLGYRFQMLVYPSLAVYLQGSSSTLLSFVRSCLHSHFHSRPTAQDLLKHPFVLAHGQDDAVLWEPVEQRQSLYRRLHANTAKLPAEAVSYDCNRSLGSGSFGTVYAGTLKGKPVAVKVVPIPHKIHGLRMLADELDCVKLLRDGKTIHGAVLQRGQVLLVTELIEGTDLGPLLFGYEGVALCSEAEVARISRDVLLALQHLHGLGILHRDVKPENIMVSRQGGVRLIDLGHACILGPDCISRQTCCTPFYAAPEMHDCTGHGHNYDVWCIGATAYALYTGMTPSEHIPGFDHDGDGEGIEVGKMGYEFREHAIMAISHCLNDESFELKTFIFTCLVVNPKYRPSASKQLENHADWFSQSAASDAQMVALCQRILALPKPSSE